MSEILHKFVKKIQAMMIIESMPQPFTNLQLEILKLYARKVSEQDLQRIKILLGQYFADQASALADEVWEKKQLTEEKILQKHRRTPYRREPL